MLLALLAANMSVVTLHRFDSIMHSRWLQAEEFVTLSLLSAVGASQAARHSKATGWKCRALLLCLI